MLPQGSFELIHIMNLIESDMLPSVIVNSNTIRPSLIPQVRTMELNGIDSINRCVNTRDIKIESSMISMDFIIRLKQVVKITW